MGKALVSCPSRLAKGMAGARRTPLRSLMTALVRAPAAASFRPQAPRFRYGVTAWGTAHFARTRPRLAAGFPLRPDAPPLSHPSWRPLVVAVGGLLRAPRDVRTVVLSVGCGRDRQRTSPMPLSWPPRAPHPRSINWPSPVDAPSSSEDYRHIFLSRPGVKGRSRTCQIPSLLSRYKRAPSNHRRASIVTDVVYWVPFPRPARPGSPGMTGWEMG